jgi:hypothetical protein
LAEFMCRQLPNVGTIPEIISSNGPSVNPPPPPQEPPVTDDVYDALTQLGPYSLPCLTDRLLDSRWTLDPRTEPLLGAPVVGDVAYMILGDKGVPDFLPQLTHKKPGQLMMDDYFLWPRVGDHRLRLQTAVREWLVKHPSCCGAPPNLRDSAPTQLKSRMSKIDLEKARSGFSRLRLGMSPEEVLKITGNPDAMDRGTSDTDHRHTNLLGFCANDHGENLAYIYFTERWTDEIARRDPLRDRYVVVFFSTEGKLTRLFSNVVTIMPMFPRTYADWLRLVCNRCRNPQKIKK